MPSTEPADPAATTETADPAVPAAVPEDTAAPAEPAVPAEPPAVPAEPPAVPEETPAVPAGEKIITFYPEPESLVIVPEPAKTATTPAKQPVTPKATATGSDAKPAAAANAGETAATKKDKNTGDKSGDKTAGKTAAKADAEVLPGIWESEAVAPSLPAVTATSAKSSTAPSRSVEMFVGQTLEVWYPATGWVFLGDASAQNGLGYQTRKMDKSDTLFSFKAVKDGNYILEFSRYDVLTDSFAQDSLAVSVAPSTSSMVKKDKIRAPDYRSLDAGVVSAAVASGTTAPAAVAATAPASTVSSAAALSSTAVAGATSSSVATATVSAADPQADTLDKAKKAVAAGDAATALTLLDSYLSSDATSIDEALYLRGQAYELNGASRNVKKALESYESLVASWPESVRWKDADARIRYINQFYLRVR